jgi:hypothetical protein
VVPFYSIVFVGGLDQFWSFYLDDEWVKIVSHNQQHTLREVVCVVGCGENQAGLGG